MKTFGLTLVFSLILGALCISPLAANKSIPLKNSLAAHSIPGKYIKIDTLEMVPW